MKNESKKINNRLFVAIICVVIVAVIAIASVYFVNRNAEVSKIPAFKVETPFIELEYPSKWQQNLNVEWSGTDRAGRVTFSAKLDNKEEKELSVIHFNEDAQMSVGILKTNDGDVAVGMSLADLQFDETWSAEEQETLYSMQEDINFTIEQLLKNKDFKDK